MYDTEPEARQVIETAKGLEGIVRNSSIHAAAVVIADRPLTDIVPLQLAEDRGAGNADGERSYRTVTQYSMKPIEEIGLLKMDFLGLRNLDVIEAALDIVEESSGRAAGHDALPLDDAKTYEMLQRGDSVGVFQFESDGMRDALRKVKPTEFNDLVALWRSTGPGAMRYIDTYARNKRNPDGVQLPGRAAALDHGVELRGDPLPGAVDADRQGDRRLLRPRGRRPAQGDRQEAARPDGRAARPLLRGRAATGTAEAVIQELWSVNEAAADYSFNRSHAACYALISYRTAWLKANYPAEYMAALISSVMSTKDKVPFFVAQCEDMGIEVLPPDVNQSGPRLQGRGGQHPLRPRRGEERGLAGGGRDPPSRARRAARSRRSGTSAAAWTAAP